jgi:hypothetical protein
MSMGHGPIRIRTRSNAYIRHPRKLLRAANSLTLTWRRRWIALGRGWCARGRGSTRRRLISSGGGRRSTRHGWRLCRSSMRAGAARSHHRNVWVETDLLRRLCRSIPLGRRGTKLPTRAPIRSASARGDCAACRNQAPSLDSKMASIACPYAVACS